MVPKKRYIWIPGESPPELGAHSVAKHDVLREYLQSYVSVLTSRLQQRRLKLTLVDGFAGGGMYRHRSTKEPIPGSPLIMLDAMVAAQKEANSRRRENFDLDVQYVFVEKDRQTANYLKNELADWRSAREQTGRWNILVGSFSEHLDRILHEIKKRSRSRRVIFLLDQYGYTDVPLRDIQRIFDTLENAEVILTFAIDWITDYLTTDLAETTLADIGIEIPSSIIEGIKMRKPSDLRPDIQNSLHKQLWEKSGASFYTPFFVFSPESSKSYWLLHFSGHAKARDVMMELHWSLHNHFQHFGRPGFFMLGYHPEYDYARQGYQLLPFNFDSNAADETRRALVGELPQFIAEEKDGIRFEDFFQRVVNHTPATRRMIAEQIAVLSREREIVIRNNATGCIREPSVQICDDDIIILPRQKKFSFRNPSE